MGQVARTEKQREFALTDVVVPIAIAVGLVLLSQVSFLWFHALAELFAVVIGVSLYLIAHHSHVFNRNGYLLFLAQGFFWAATVDLFHALAYSGMGLIAGEDPNAATLLWLLARSLEAGTLLLAPSYLGTRQPPRWSFFAFGALACGGMTLVFADQLPAAYRPGTGLTPFKIVTEYIIIATLAGASLHLHLRRTHLDAALYGLMLGILALTMLSEFAFTIYVGVYDISNLIGHIFKFWAFWLLLFAIGRWMLAQPFRTLSRDANSFDFVPMPVLLTDGQGIIQSCNDEARRLRPAGGIGKALHEVWHPGGLSHADCPVCRALQAGQDCEIVLQDSDLDRWAEIRLHPIKREGGAQGFVCVHTDITDMYRSHQRLMQAEKMEAIGHLSGGLAHDFNNMLGIVLGSLQLLSSRIGDDEKARKHLDLALNGARRAADVTRSLLAVARRQSLEPKAVDLHTMLGELMPLLTQSVGKTVDITLKTRENLHVHVDPSGLGNAILNLVINARDAMPSGGRIDIEALPLQVEAGMHGFSPDLVPGHYIVIGVSDTGTGMSAQILAHAFEPFYTTKERGKGTGLGLAMVHGFARQSGGTATLYSQPDKGTTVRLYLPAIARDVGSTRLPVTTEILPQGQGECILVVDDEDALLSIACEWLSGLGYQVIRASDPRQALELLAAHACQALFTDVAMPGGIDGPTLAALARERQPGLRVLFATGYAGKSDGDISPLLNKPYSRADLARALRTLLDGPASAGAAIPS